jgi:cephalosporin hydroxylase
MNGERDFVDALSKYLALHTEQSTGRLKYLITSFLQGAQADAQLEPAEKKEIRRRLDADIAALNNVPTFLQDYLHACSTQDRWPTEATFLASLYLRRRADERFVPWARRQQFVALLGGELVHGSELSFRQLLYSQGAESVFRWRGVPCFKTVYDLAIYIMLVDELRPGTIIELGAGVGGSALFFADLCQSAGLTTDVISIDVAAGEVADPRIKFVQSDCFAWLAEAATSKREFRRPCLVIEDFHGDLGRYFGDLDLILQAGDYLVIEDSSVKQNPIAQVIADRPYLVDTKYTDFFGINCTSALNSIFVKDGGAPAPPRRDRNERQRLRDQDRAWRQRQTREP